jgi:hypothetical protein
MSFLSHRTCKHLDFNLLDTFVDFKDRLLHLLDEYKDCIDVIVTLNCLGVADLIVPNYFFLDKKNQNI